MISPRTKARLAAGAVVVGGVLSTAVPAHALLPSPQADAYVVSADAFGNFLAVPATPHSTYPSGGTQTAVGLNAGPFATSATLTATTSGDPSTGEAHATATVQQLGITLPAGASASVTGVNSTCDATPSGAPTGNGVITGGSVTLPVGGPITLTANAQPNTSISVPGVATITLNEQTTSAQGLMTVNAVHIVLLPALGGANVIIGHAQCGAAAATGTNDTPMVSTPVAAGAVATAAVGGVVMLRRRNRKQGVSSS